MVLVVLGFVVLTAYAVIASYGPLVAAGGARAAGAFFALLFFCLLVRKHLCLGHTCFSAMPAVDRTLPAASLRTLQCTGKCPEGKLVVTRLRAVFSWENKSQPLSTGNCLARAPAPSRKCGSKTMLNPNVAAARQVAALLWAYFAAVLVDPGRVPPGWHPFGSDEVPFWDLFQHS